MKTAEEQRFFRRKNNVIILKKRFHWLAISLLYQWNLFTWLIQYGSKPDIIVVRADVNEDRLITIHDLYEVCHRISAIVVHAVNNWLDSFTSDDLQAASVMLQIGHKSCSSVSCDRDTRIKTIYRYHLSLWHERIISGAAWWVWHSGCESFHDTDISRNLYSFAASAGFVNRKVIRR